MLAVLHVCSILTWWDKLDLQMLFFFQILMETLTDTYNQSFLFLICPVFKVAYNLLPFKGPCNVYVAS